LATTFEDVLNQALAMLQRQGRVSYRALKRQFGLDDEYLEDLKAEIIEVHQRAVDQDAPCWSGLGTLARPWSQHLHPPREPRYESGRMSRPLKSNLPLSNRAHLTPNAASLP
jgi:hypothetical protein